MLPLPMLGPFDAFAPAIRYWVLTVAAGAVAFTEGASGPVPAILALLGVHALLATGLAWLCAWLAAKSLASLSPSARRRAVLLCVAACTALAIVFELYRTPFGRAPSANLLAILS